MTRQQRVFEAFARFVLAHRVVVLVGVLLITGGFAWSLSTLPVLTSLKDILPRDAAMKFYEDSRARFGGDEVVFVAVESDDHFTAEGLERLEGLTFKYEDHPLVERVTSLTRTDWIRAGDGGSLAIDRFYDEFDPAPPDRVKRRVLADDLVAGNLISADGRIALIVITLVPSDDDEWAREAVAAYVKPQIERLPGGAKQLEFPGGKSRAIEVAKQLVAYEFHTLATHAGYTDDTIHITGFPAIFGSLLVESERVISVFLPICAGMLILILFIVLRRPIDVILPMICVAPAVVWAVGGGGLIFGRLTIITSVAPIMVLVVGMSDVVHLVTQFRHELARGLEKEAAIIVAFRDVGAACTLTSLTTLIGFGSMILLPLPHARELGTFAGLGVVAAFLIAFLLTPVLLSFTKARPPKVAPSEAGFGRLLSKLADALAGRPKQVLVVCLMLTIATVVAVLQIQIENDLARKLPEDHRLRRAARVVEAALGGSGELEIVVDLGAPDAIKQPGVLDAIWRFQKEIDTLPTTVLTRSVGDIFGRIHRIMAPDLAAKNPMPQGRTIAEYLLLFGSAGGELDQMLDPSRQHVRIMVREPNLTAEMAIEIADRVAALAGEILPEGVKAEVTGIGMLAARGGPIILENSLKGLGGALALIAVLMALLFGSLRVGLLSVIPNILPVAMGVAVVWLVLPQVDADTMIYLTICIGIAVDDTIHFLARYRLERTRGLDRDAAVKASILEAGHGIVRTSAILVGGFSVMLLSDYLGLQTLGLLLPMTMIAAVALDLTMVPAMAQLGLLEPRLGRDSGDAEPPSEAR